MMTERTTEMKFETANFSYSNGWLHYDDKFVARFRMRADRAGFVKFLKANFTVEEYFAEMKNGVSPSNILKSKGYMSKTVCDLLKRMGLPQTQAGLITYLNRVDQIVCESSFEWKLKTLSDDTLLSWHRDGASSDEQFYAIRNELIRRGYFKSEDV